MESPSRSYDELRSDQDRFSKPLRPYGQIQPAPPHRGRARRPRSLRLQENRPQII